MKGEVFISAACASACVAVIDSGILPAHWEFDSLQVRVDNTLLDEARRLHPLREFSGPSHDTSVSSVIAAQRGGPAPIAALSNRDLHGIAWGIDSLEVKAIPLVSGGGPYREIL